MEKRTLNVVIVDDEPLARARLRRMLAEIDGVRVVDEAASAKAAREAIARRAPTCCCSTSRCRARTASRCSTGSIRGPRSCSSPRSTTTPCARSRRTPSTTLLKPFRRERLVESLDRARRELERPDDLARRLNQLLADLERHRGGGSEHLERITVRVGTRQIILRADEILWFGAEDKLVFAATAGDRHYVNFTLDQLEKRLDPRRFLRVHRGAIVELGPRGDAAPRLRGHIPASAQGRGAQRGAGQPRARAPAARAAGRMIAAAAAAGRRQ